MASSVTAPLERQFGQVPGLSQMTSTSSVGSSVITLQFALDLNIDVAEQEVQAAINAAATYLPDRPAQSAHLQQDQPGRRAHPDAGADLRDAAAVQGRGPGRHALAQKISQLPGVGLVSISGGQKPAVRMQANPDRAGVLRAEPGGPAHGARCRPTSTRPRASFDGAAAVVHHRRQRPAALQRPIHGPS